MHRGGFPLGLLILIIMLTACATSTIAPTPLPSPSGIQPALTAPINANVVTITFGGNEYERGIYQPLIDQFEQEHPDINIQFVSLDSIYQNQSGGLDPVAVARQIVSTVDTAAIGSLDAQAVSHGYFYDLEPLMNADPSFDREDFFPGALAAVQDQARTFMVPRAMYVPLLVYNKDLWSSRSVPSPHPDWTWADMISAAEQLASKRGETIEVYGLVDWDGMMVLSGELAQQNSNFAWGSTGQAQLDRPDYPTMPAAILSIGRSRTNRLACGRQGCC